MNTYKIAHNEVDGYFWSNDLRKYVDSGLSCLHEIYVNKDMAIGIAEDVDGHVVYHGEGSRWATLEVEG